MTYKDKEKEKATRNRWQREYIATPKTNKDGTFTCYICRLSFARTEEYWHKNKRISDNLSQVCKDCAKAYTRQRTKRLRDVVLKAYGGDIPTCSCPGCTESHEEFLILDNTEGGGNTHRKAIKCRSGQPFYGWIIKNAFPAGFRLLCHNCNMSLANYGYCPHEQEGRE
jgi:hypothetical protein